MTNSVSTICFAELNLSLQDTQNAITQLNHASKLGSSIPSIFRGLSLHAGPDPVNWFPNGLRKPSKEPTPLPAVERTFPHRPGQRPQVQSWFGQLRRHSDSNCPCRATHIAMLLTRYLQHVLFSNALPGFTPISLRTHAGPKSGPKQG